MMRKFLALLLLLAATAAFAHAGHHHKYLGTVTSMHDDQVTIHTTDGHDVTFAIVKTTEFKRDDADAKRSDMTVGIRVAVEMQLDGKSARVVKIGKAGT